jgi:DNA-repair protein complementing XP-A cells
MELTAENARIMAENRQKGEHNDLVVGTSKHNTEYAFYTHIVAKLAIQERERVARARQQQQMRERQQSAGGDSSMMNINGKRPLTAIPADSTSPTAPHKRTHPSTMAATAAAARIPPGSSRALQDALASGSGDARGVKHFQGPDDNAPLKNMIGTYVESVAGPGSACS